MSFPPYPEYKDSGVEWLGEVPAHWQSKRLKFLFDIQKRGVREEDQIVTCFRDGMVTLRKNRRSEGFTNALQEIGYQGIRSGDLVIHAMDAFAGAIGVSDSDGKSSPVYSVCVPVSPDVSPYYYARLLRHMALSGFVASLAKGIRERSTDFRWTDAAEIFLPVPTADEQVKITRFLDHETTRIDALVKEQQRLIELLKEKRQAVISHAVTKGLDPDVPLKDSGVEWLGAVPAHWEVGRVKNVASFITSGPRGWSDYLTESGEEIFVQSGDLDDHIGVNFENAKRIRSPMGAEGARTRINCGDVLVCITGANTGRVAVSDLPPVSAFINQHLSLVRLNQVNALPEFVGYALSSESIQSFFRVEQYGLKEGLSLSDVADAPLVLPPKYEQELVMKYLKDQTQRLDRLAIDAERSVELLQERRSALISAAVTGKIDVRGWQQPAGLLAPAETTQTEAV
ncbi:restriction endonuclease subunit S [Halomonas chromatireducens]|uniref:EcoKI restriction-modification system protein HsdS n=1 Tax=Halomonas chromatireducens TaxID=507626 RepID=A0A109UNA3_9GAMM|nr:restriction endonuclease subunit S [Halomonas chromatireducens]AMD02499.1 EcoKI restriction-modification system protein HsdS [Halomonas chromatireducens]